MLPRRYFMLSVLLAPMAVVTGIAVADKAGEPPAEKARDDDSTEWHDVRGLCVEGKGWAETKSPFDRLPAKAEGVVRGPVWDLGRDSAGYCVRFVSDAPSIRARWTLTDTGLGMPHMAPSGVSGLDLYVKDVAGRWSWVAVGIPETFPTNVSDMVVGLPAGKREFLLFLPLYNGVTSVEVGVPKGSRVAPPDPSSGRGRKPIVFYGTSITQGGCATRPGMAYTAILRRRLDWPVINLGFSGNGKMEPEVAALLAELDPSLYVIDSVANMKVEEVRQRVEPLVRSLRGAHPRTPILLVEGARASGALATPQRGRLIEERNAELRAAYGRLIAAGVPDLHYMPGESLLGHDGEGTVDGAHPTDLGFERMASALAPAMTSLLRESIAAE